VGYLLAWSLLLDRLALGDAAIKSAISTYFRQTGVLSPFLFALFHHIDLYSDLPVPSSSEITSFSVYGNILYLVLLFFSYPQQRIRLATQRTDAATIRSQPLLAHSHCHACPCAPLVDWRLRPEARNSRWQVSYSLLYISPVSNSYSSFPPSKQQIHYEPYEPRIDRKWDC